MWMAPASAVFQNCYRGGKGLGLPLLSVLPLVSGNVKGNRHWANVAKPRSPSSYRIASATPITFSTVP